MSLTLRENQSKFAKMAAELILKAYELGYEVTLGDAKEGKQYPSAKNQELSVETQINAYSEGCYVE